MMNKLILAVSTTVILAAANAAIGWIARKLDTCENSKCEKDEKSQV